MANESIKSETSIIFGLILGLLKMPLLLVLSTFGKSSVKEAFNFIPEFFVEVIKPKFTTAIIAINILIFIISLFFPEDLLITLVNYPADFMSERIFSLITSGFLHANLLHLFSNMLAIFIFGRIVERELGEGKTAFVYFSAMIIAGIFSSIVNLFILGNNIPGLGASGAVMGLVAAAILLGPFTFVYELLIPFPVMVLGWLTIAADITGILSAQSDGIGHFAHLGGFLSVFLLLPFLDTGDRNRMKKGIITNIITLCIAIIVYFVILNFA